MLGPHVGVGPVEVGLLGREEVEVPLAVFGARPRRAAEDRLPGVRLGLARAEPEARPLRRAGRRGERRLEPLVLARDVVRDDVDDRADPEGARFGDQLLCLGERPERRVDRAVVGDVVAVVGERRRVPGAEPDRVDAELAQVRQMSPDAGEVADPVTVRVGEAPDVDLVDDGVAPPGAVGAPGALLAWEGIRLGGRRDRADRVELCHVAASYRTANKWLQERDEHSQELAQFLKACASVKTCGSRRIRPRRRDRGGRGAAPGHDLGLEEELFGRDGRAFDLADEHLDRGPADRLDRLPDGRERRIGAAHERRVVVADDRQVGRHRQAGAARGADRSERERDRTRTRCR